MLMCRHRSKSQNQSERLLTGQAALSIVAEHTYRLPYNVVAGLDVIRGGRNIIQVRSVKDYSALLCSSVG